MVGLWEEEEVFEDEGEDEEDGELSEEEALGKGWRQGEDVVVTHASEELSVTTIMHPIFVAWPSAPLTHSLVCTSIAALGQSTSILPVLPSPPPPSLIQWASYDCIDHALTAAQPNHVLSSSYTIRKALIRKHFLARCIQSYLVKRPGSLLAKAVPPTWDIDIAYADELDEMWSDELWDLGSMLDANSRDIKRWFILKPGMADRGMGIRLFDSKDALYNIFQEFDRDPDEEEADESTTSVMTSQLRHFVLQVSVMSMQWVSKLSAHTGVHFHSVTCRSKPGPAVDHGSASMQSTGSQSHFVSLRAFANSNDMSDSFICGHTLSLPAL